MCGLGRPCLSTMSASCAFRNMWTADHEGPPGTHGQSATRTAARESTFSLANRITGGDKPAVLQNPIVLLQTRKIWYNPLQNHFLKVCRFVRKCILRNLILLSAPVQLE